MNKSDVVHIADILPPPVPDVSVIDFRVYVLLLAVILFIVVFRYLRSSEQRLKRLSKQYQQHKLDKRRCAFELSELMRQHMKGSAKNLSSMREQKNKKAWQEYSTTLQVARYSRQGLSDDAMAQLLHDTERWLQRR